MERKQRILAIEAHPDDLAFFYGGYIAKMTDGGNDVRVLTVTNGDQSTCNPAISRDAIVAMLKEEHAKAMGIVGVKDQRFLDGFTNHFMFSSETQLKLREVLIREIREYKPDTVVTFDIADVFEENPDHRLLARLGLQAASFAAYPLVHPEQLEQGLEPHFTGRMLLAPTKQPNVFVEISNEPIDKKKAAGAAYKSQLDLMFSELKFRARTMGLKPDLDDIEPQDLWESVCESMAEEAARAGNEYYEQHGDISPRLKLIQAEAFRMQYLGAMEKIHEYLPREYQVL
ncbi:MAG: PIG-L family deacetylase [Candidatus Lokiarchaeota archaeon]|nr:PIG-L family deacetylase [Candidatus Lokiarchaeota archaeon]